MKSDSGWWAKRLPAQPAARQVAPAQYQPPPPQPQYQQPQQGYPQHGYQQPQPEVSVDNIIEAVAAWQGGEATRTETTRCPSCGGDHYFSRAQGAHRGPPPAPMCYSCGFTGLFQQGDPSVWQAGG